MDSRYIELAPCTRRQASIMRFAPWVQGHARAWAAPHLGARGKTSAAGGSSYLPCWLAYGRNHDVNDAEAEDLVVKLDIDVEIGPQLTLPTKLLETCRRGCTCEQRSGIWTPLLRQIYSMGPMVRLRRASPRTRSTSPHRATMDVAECVPNVQTQAVQGPCARRGIYM